jgi:hypothetical protein
MIIGFDLDRVFINYPPFVPAFVIDYLYKNHNHKLSYRIPTSPLEILIRKLSHIPIFRPPITENINYLRQLHSQGNHSLHLVSSRYGFLQAQTIDLLKRYRFYDCFTSVNLNLNNEQAHIFKLRILKQLKADIFVDDDAQLLEYLSQSHLKAKLLQLHPGQPLKELFNQS